jgi:radical SAM superfamily enzyme YgiQ (UPF0313 family)
VLEHLAGLVSHLRPGWDLRLINANVEDFDARTAEADLVGITVLTHQAKWAYRMADLLRERGVRVVLGGPHPSALPDEASLHADAVLAGEAEAVMEELLSDLERGALKARYDGEFRGLSGLPFPRRDLLPGYAFHGFSTSRGCPYQCTFCATPHLHGTAVRHRPVDEVVADIASFRHRMWFSTDADIWGPDVSRSVDLFRAMAAGVPHIRWVGEASLGSVQHERGGELLRWARKSGLMQVWIGWESFSNRRMRAYRATRKLLVERETALKKIRDNGIDVVLFLMLGAKGESMEEYARVLEVTDRLAITPHPVMVVPYPGTALREEVRDDLVYGDDWDYYDGMHSVIRHGDGNRARDEALLALWRELFTVRRMTGRLTKLPLAGFPLAHGASFMVQSSLRKAFREFSDVFGIAEPKGGLILAGRSVPGRPAT